MCVFQNVPQDSSNISLHLVNFSAVTIGFLETTYNVSEDVGLAQLRVGIINGSLDTEIVISLATADDTAVCTLLFLITNI